MELHLGKDGATMNIGTGGMDASVGTVANALKGAAVLGADGLALLYEAAAKWKDLNESETDMMKARAELAERMYGFGGNEENGLALKDALVSVLSGWKAFAFGTNEDRAGVLATAIGIAMLDEEEFRGAMSILNEWKSLLDPGSFSVPFNASDTEMPKTTSVSDTIENNAGKIGDTVDKLNFPPWAIEFIGDSMDVINWLESGDHFTFMEGLYLAYRGVLDIKIATGNMINSFPSAGIYGRNLFEGGDRYSVTVGLGNGTPVWNGLDQFGNYRASLNYLSDSRFAMTMSLCGNMFAANLFSKFILGLKWWM
jgi:hypothetical protein